MKKNKNEMIKKYSEIVGNTNFAYDPDVYASEEMLKKAHTDFINRIGKNSFFDLMINSIKHFVLILNRNMQVVYINAELQKYLNKDKVDESLGRRLGDVFNCQHWIEEKQACGSSQDCINCGVFSALLKGVAGKEAEQECMLQSHDGIAHHFMVKTSPLEIETEAYIVVSLTDIREKKQREHLEHIFFHDLINTTGALQGFIQVFEKTAYEDKNRILEMVKNIVAKLLDEIRAQQQLIKMEAGNLRVEKSSLNSQDFLKEFIGFYSSFSYVQGKHIVLEEGSESFDFFSDRALLSRVLLNLIKNALEEEGNDAIVVVSARKNDENKAEFFVKNKRVIAEDVQPQVFTKSFSTKGIGRGLGAFSSKMLVERYLQGEISFVSNKQEGTVFKIVL